MAWLSSNDFTASDYLSYQDMNNLANDIRTWGGNVNGGGYILSNVILEGVTFPGGTSFMLNPTIPGINGQVLTIDTADPVGYVWANPTGGGGGGGPAAVESVFTRTGNVIAEASDYSAFYIMDPATPGVDGQVLTIDTAAPNGLVWATPIGAVESVFTRTGNIIAEAQDYSAFYPSLTGSYPDPPWITSLAWDKITGAPATLVTSFNNRSGAVMPATGDYNVTQVTDALADPTIDTGDLLVRSGGGEVVRLPVGIDGQVLTVDSESLDGIAWINLPPAGGPEGSQTPWATDIDGNQQILFNAAGIGINVQPAVLLDINGPAVPPTYNTTNPYNPSGTLFRVLGGPNGLTVGVWDVTNNYATWLQSGFIGPIVAPYAMLLNPFGGNVSVCAATPQARLEVWGSGGPPPTAGVATPASFRVGTVQGGNCLDFGAYDGSPYGLWLQTTDRNSVGTTGYPLCLQPSGGVVGIGTQYPSSKLDVTGGAVVIHMDSTVASGGGPQASQLQILGQTNPATFLTLGFDTATSNVGVIQAGIAAASWNNLCLNPFGGNVGIGTIAAPNQLSIIPNANPPAFQDSQIMIGEQSNNPGYRVYVGFYAPAGEWSGVIQTVAGGGGAPLLLNPNGGNVGINTTLPLAELALSNAVVTDKIHLYNSQTGDVYGLGMGNSTIDIYCGAVGQHIAFGAYDGTTFTEWGCWAYGGFGIGTALPNVYSQLTVNGPTPNLAANALGYAGGAIEVIDTTVAAGGGGAILFTAAGGSWRFAGIKGYATNGGGYSLGDLVFYVRTDINSGALSEAMRIAGGGADVIIGASLGVGGNATVSGAAIVANQLTVGPSSISQAGDIGVARVSNPATGVVYFGNTTGAYIYWDGGQFNFQGGNVSIANALTVAGTVNTNSQYLVNGQPLATSLAPGSARDVPPFFTDPNGGRAFNVNYVNNTDRTVFVTVLATVATNVNGGFQIWIGGVGQGAVIAGQFSLYNSTAYNTSGTVFAVVPPQYYYYVTTDGGGATINFWLEYN